MIRPVFGEKMPAGITQIEKKPSSFIIYPNPLNSSNLHFDLKEGGINHYQLEIYNITGQRLLSAKLTPTVDVSILKNGVYLIRLINTENGNSDTQKLIIKR